MSSFNGCLPCTGYLGTDHVTVKKNQIKNHFLYRTCILVRVCVDGMGANKT